MVQTEDMEKSREHKGVSTVVVQVVLVHIPKKKVFQRYTKMPSVTQQFCLLSRKHYFPNKTSNLCVVFYYSPSINLWVVCFIRGVFLQFSNLFFRKQHMATCSLHSKTITKVAYCYFETTVIQLHFLYSNFVCSSVCINYSTQ